MTSTLQQEAGRKLRFSAQRAMQVAQRLYEQGCITYMRTDSTTLSDEALTAARTQAREMYGDAYVPDAPRRYERKVKNAQEAHEAIRPAGETFRTPDQAGRELSGDELRLYELIWKRTVASQMNDATGTSAQIRLTATVPRRRAAGPARPSSRASGRVIAFPGFLRAYVEGERRPRRRAGRPRASCCRALAVGDAVDGQRLRARLAHHPAPGPLHRGLAGQGDGGARAWAARPPTPASSRPSSTAATSGRRARRWSRASPPSPSSGLLERYFGDLVDYGFTASDGGRPRRDRRGREEALPGSPASTSATAVPGGGTVAAARSRASGSRPRSRRTWARSTPGRSTPSRSATATDGAADRGPGRPLRPLSAARRGPGLHPRRHGARRADDRAGRGDAGRAANDRVLGTDPETGLDVAVKAGRFGPYVQLGEATEGGDKPRTASLFPTMDAGDAHARAGPRAAAASRGWSGRTPTRARRSWPTTAASART